MLHPFTARLINVNKQILQETQFMLEELDGISLPAFLDDKGEIILHQGLTLA